LAFGAFPVRREPSAVRDDDALGALGAHPDVVVHAAELLLQTILGGDLDVVLRLAEPRHPAVATRATARAALEPDDAEDDHERRGDQTADHDLRVVPPAARRVARKPRRLSIDARARRAGIGLLPRG